MKPQGAAGGNSDLGSTLRQSKLGVAAGRLGDEAPCRHGGWSETRLITCVIDNELLRAVGRNFWAFDCVPGLGSGHCCGAESSRLLGPCLSWTQRCFNSCRGRQSSRH